MKTVLIFGCSGFVGKYLKEEFWKHGYHVVGSDLYPKNSVNENTVFEPCDLLDENTVFALIKTHQPDYLINLAAISSVALSWKIPKTTFEVNVNGSLNILEAVRKLQINCKILLIGSSEEYGKSSDRLNESCVLKENNPYGASKIMQEHLANVYRMYYKLNIITTRTFNHTGIGQSDAYVIPSFVKQVSAIQKGNAENKIRVGNLDAVRTWGDVRDMARAYRMILEGNSDKLTFNVGNEQSFRLHKILDYILSLSTKRIEITPEPSRMRPIDNPMICCDNSLLKNETGWTPSYTIFDTINEMYQWYCNQDT